ncbi:uncharacterized protein LOC110715248 [Chenopodium quinoa]|uniref:uncharacterized protein LOC110715248 n=1 Tax=Chenopodium quinoa TaxID=63459 RepID=UPI000B7963F7|nr:uncharacterized protein LOC110715248 [Chenopodium quinoa]
MEIFIKAENYQVWRVIEVGDFEVTKTNAQNEVIPKPMSEYEKEDFDKMEINAMAVKLLHSGLGPHEHNCVMGCKNAKEIWDLLQITHEGTNEVKRSKIDLLMSKYERFKMHPKETIQEMLTRFTNNINELVSLGRQIPIDEQVRKVLRSLPQDERWRAKVTALQETKDFTKFNIEQLAGSLMTHELHLGVNTEPMRNKGLARKADEEEDSEVDEDEASLIVRRFKKMFKKGRTLRNFAIGRKTSNTKPDYSCHKCGSPDHFIRDCPLWENDKGKGKAKEQGREKFSKANYQKSNMRKAMIAAWGDSESEEEDDDQPEEETANLYLKVCKEHGAWLETVYAKSQSKLRELDFKYKHITEIADRIKNESILLNVELTQYKLINSDISSSNSSSDQLLKFNVDFENLKNELSTLKTQKDQLESEQNSRKDRSIDPKVILKWIIEAQGKRTEDLGYMTKKKGKQKKYVELPSMKVLVRGNNSWYLDNGCSKHMTGDKSKFLSLEDCPGGTLTFGDNKKGEIIGKGKIGRSKSHSIDNVFLVEGLMHNLLSISQFSDKGNSVSFTSDSCNIINNKSGKLRARNLVVGLPIIKFLQNKVCDACVKGKHVRSSFKLKKMFVAFAKKIQKISGHSIVHLKSDHGTEFENSRFDEFCRENGMNHNFSAPKNPQRNGVVERKNRTLEEMARTMLIASGLPRNF